LEGERYLPERILCGRQDNKLQYPLPTAAALHDRTELDVLDEATWSQTDDFCQYSLSTAVACLPGAASWAGAPVMRLPQSGPGLRPHSG
jgi:hypothetical protein